MADHDGTLDLLTPIEAAAALRANPRTIERWRTSGGGPAFVKVGRGVVYRRADLEHFVRRNTRAQTADDAVRAKAAR